MSMSDTPLKAMLAFDLGAENCRAMLGWIEHDCLLTDEIRRFPNEALQLPDGLHWTIFAMFQEMKRAIADALAACDASGMELVSIGIDSWGVDYGLIDPRGAILGIPYHYRDQRTLPVMAAAHERMPERELYAATGVRSSPLNTLYQLLADREEQLFGLADQFLMIPDLLGFWLTGEATAEMTNASTTQMLDTVSRTWAKPVIDTFDFPTSMFPPLVEPGTIKGTLSPHIADEFGIGGLSVVNVASHDTASAFAAADGGTGTMVISTGTWFLVGSERDTPIQTEAAMADGFTNELSFGGRIRFIKNCSGLWLLQEARRFWNRDGLSVSYANLSERAAVANPLQSLIDPDSARFDAPGRMVERIMADCAEHGESIPDSPGSVVRCIIDSLALNMRRALDQLEARTGEPITQVVIVGGGAKSLLLCEAIADATNRPTLVGAEEATAIGNLLVQTIANGFASTLDEARAFLPPLEQATRFEPTTAREEWETAYERFKRISSESAV